MTNPEGDIFLLTSEDIPQGAAQLDSVTSHQTDTGSYMVDETHTLFCADGSLAGDLFIDGIAYNQKLKGNDALIVLNPNDEVNLPVNLMTKQDD